jgi:ATP-dependent DNA helicase DinG
VTSTSESGSALADLAKVVASLGGTERTSQMQMVEAVSGAIAQESVLMVQAGTGTGKSLGYLVPAAHAIAANGGKVVVSTATLALQRQLLERDLPAIVEGVQAARPLTYAVLKGRGNYLCQARLAGEPGDSPDEELPLGVTRGTLEKQAGALRDWAYETITGDRDDYRENVDARVWRAMSATGRECVGPTRCSFAEDCFSEQAKSAAAVADIVITNHALLALDTIDDAALLPEHEILIVDEAHEFVSRATSAATADLTVFGAERALRTARTISDGATTDRFDEAITGLNRVIVGLGEDRKRLESVPDILIEPLAALRDAAHLLMSEIGKDDSVEPAQRHRAASAVEEVHDVAGRLLAAADEDVIWSGGATGTGLHVAPLSVADEISDRLSEQLATVFTSATLTLGGGFEPLARELGLGRESEWSGVDVGSPFEYGKQGILYVAADLPKPGRDGLATQTLARMGDLISAAGGRTLVLLSSWRAVDTAGEWLLEQDFDMSILVQRRGESVAHLVNEFIEDETSVLVGTMSLFQGVDVPGDPCVCVIIDKIPFPRPDDPVLEARSRKVERAGGSGFAAVSLPRAGLLLAQGAGRLIRSGTDRGVVAILDPRLATAGYRDFLLKSLPPFWATTNETQAIAALKRLSGTDSQSAVD